MSLLRPQPLARVFALAATLLPVIGAASAAHAQRPLARRLYQQHPARAAARPGVTVAYDGLKKTALEVMGLYPPSSHYYVGVGRSPSALVAFFRTVSADGEDTAAPHNTLASSIPASAVQAVTPPQHNAEYFRHFDHMLPPDVREGRRSVVLIDNSSGRSLLGLKRVLDAYFAHKGVQTRVLTLSLHGAARQRNTALDAAVQGGGGDQSAAEYKGEQRDGGHRIGTGAGYGRLEDLRPNPTHASFRQAIEEHLRNDAAFDEHMARTLPDIFRARDEITAAPPAPAGAVAPGPDPVDSQQPLVLTRRHVQHTVLNPAIYRAFRHGTAQLLENFAPRNSFYLGVGRSSSGIVGFLENLGAAAGYLPVDGLNNEGAVSPELERQIFGYFERFIPANVRNAGQTVVLFQRSNTGRSLPLLGSLLEKYLRQTGSRTTVRLAAFVPQGVTVANATAINASAHQALVDMNGDTFKPISVYTYHRIGTSEAAGLERPRPEYEQFKRALLGYMRADRTIPEMWNGRAP